MREFKFHRLKSNFLKVNKIQPPKEPKTIIVFLYGNNSYWVKVESAIKEIENLMSSLVQNCSDLILPK
jgi:hypothetical protein